MSHNHIRMVLVRPEEAGNVGAAARVLKNFGFQHLVLVNPRLARPQEAYKWARGAEDIVESADIVDSLEEALGPCAQAWATTRRIGKQRGGSTNPHDAARDMSSLVSEGHAVAWVFGPESGGLTTEDLSRCSNQVRIATAPEQPSLNLAQAVAIASYETHLALGPVSTPAQAKQATIEERAAFYDHLETALLSLGFLLPHTAETRMAMLKGVFERAAPTPAEVRLLRGMARKILRAGKELEKQERQETDS